MNLVEKAGANIRRVADGRRVLFFSHSYYLDLDTSNGVSVASRKTMEALSRRGFAVEALTGAISEGAGEVHAAKI